MHRQKEWQTGRSNSSGFELNWFYRTRGKIIIVSDNTAGFRRESVEDLLAKSPLSLRIFFFLVFFVITGMVCLSFSSVIFIYYGLKAAAWCLLGLGLFFSPILRNLSIDTAVTYGMYCRDPFYRERKQWHAAEHKAINLLQKSLPLTMENLRKMQNFYPFYQTCGSLFLCSYFSLYLSLIGFLLVFFLLSFVIALYGAVIAGFMFFFWCNSFFAYRFFYFLQAKFFTSEPTENQLKESIDCIKRCKERLETLKSAQ